MSSRVHSYLRTHRRRWALTKPEIAILLGYKSPTHISRVEQGERQPVLLIVLAYEILFGVAPRELLPQLYEEIEDAVMARASELYEKVESDTSQSAMRKKELLSAALKRAIIRHNNKPGT